MALPPRLLETPPPFRPQGPPLGQHLALLREVLSRARPLAWADYLAGQAAALDDPGEGRAPFHRLATAVVERLVAWLQRAAEMFCGEEPTPGAGRSGANSPPRMGSSPRCSSPNDRRGAGGHKGPSARQARALRAALGEVPPGRRLSCQFVLDARLDGLVVTLPAKQG